MTINNIKEQGLYPFYKDVRKKKRKMDNIMDNLNNNRGWEDYKKLDKIKKELVKTYNKVKDVGENISLETLDFIFWE